MYEGNKYNSLDKVRISGRIVREFEKSHAQNDCKFLKTMVCVPRQSGNVDILPIIVSENYVSAYKDTNVIGKYIELSGRFCSFAMFNPITAPNVERYIFANMVHICDTAEELDYPIGTNMVTVQGEIKEDPALRKTNSEKIVSSFCVLSYRKSGKADRIPCIAWNSNALDIVDLGAGSKIQFKGRLQSRDYVKVDSHDEQIMKTAYEVSIFSYDVISASPRYEYER